MENTIVDQPMIYSEEEKVLLVNYFILKDDCCKVNFKNYVVNYVTNYGKLVEEEYRKQPRNPSNVQAHDIVINYEYNSYNIMWGNEKNDNLVTYILSHPDFDAKNTRMKALNFVRPNWNHVNNEGNNALHYLARSGKYEAIENMLKQQNIDTELKNNNGEYYTLLLLNPGAFPAFHCKLGRDTAFISTSLYIKKIMDIFSINIEHFLNSTNDQIVEIKANIINVKNSMIKFLEDNPKYDKNKSIKIYEEAFRDLDKFINYVHLQTKVPKIKKLANRVKI